jgi:hypothetical protein
MANAKGENEDDQLYEEIHVDDNEDQLYFESASIL